MRLSLKLALWVLATILTVLVVKPPIYVEPCTLTTGQPVSFSSAMYGAQASLRW